VSGEVTLIDGGDQRVARLVHTAAALFARPGFGPAALVGGLAVTVRLATVHRATNDVDVVSGGEGPERMVLEYLGDRDAAGTRRRMIDGIKVDVISTEPLPDAASDLPDEDGPRLFVLGHRWALESAESAEIRVASQAGTQVVAGARLAVATAPALLACKLHAISDRSAARPEKQESDATDLVRLVSDLVGVPRLDEQFATAPFDLPALVDREVRRWFIEDSLRMARLVNVDGSGRVEPATIAALGRLFGERLAPSAA